MKTTGYFDNDVRVRRPYIRDEWCEQALREPFYKEIQIEDKRVRWWIFIESEQRWFRVVTLEDGETIHNAFFDRTFKPKEIP